MEMPNPDKERVADGQEPQQVELIKEIIGAATDAGKRYQRQLALAKNMARREWKLSVRALVLVLVGVLLLVAVVATLWMTLNATLAMGLYQLGLHWMWIGSGVLLLNGLVLLGIVSTIRALLKHIGFSRAWDALTLSSDPTSETPD
ncbi:MAG: hypothetical protein ACW7DR_14785 [Paraglaciecola chathamensis]|jgi:hypothetical protein|uniref:Holin-X, holin superfamily III n=2 Tax=Paraglaciecola chathamensis TaxID=368405 RepID=A0A8H9I6N1_9ALTE|nr:MULTISPECIES: hypothetical protein [Paraglaciecola]AEE21860.1 hypothetical protein Glaag_0898 [Glaciecola sp. 4H-3-7+YE-5]MDO6841329.1 hypothetical protein [Paraglaciecola chathamensis]GAC04678.1 hypothetical protein GAGA_1823 [Paraglaciecola agarilytica NO2]GGZ47694.1 hypothetical protein GCM10011274_01750 [Paraglaciecola oceanifecundans]